VRKSTGFLLVKNFMVSPKNRYILTPVYPVIADNSRIQEIPMKKRK
jgi:hypothetical protein